MAYIVEDGTVVANANGYETLVNIRAYAADRGIALSGDDAILAPLAIKATDYLESKAPFYVGKPTSITTQALSWPRSFVRVDENTWFPSNQIPQALKNAQAQLCIEQFNGVDIMPTIDPQSGGYVVREKIDVIETQYSERIGTTREPIMPKVDALLAGLLYNGGAFATRSIRV